jgi:hypothetical protein
MARLRVVLPHLDTEFSQVAASTFIDSRGPYLPLSGKAPKLLRQALVWVERRS